MGDPVSLVAGPVVKVISSLTANFIKEQYHLVYGVEDEVEKLERSMSAIQATLTEIEGSLSDTSSKPLQDWLIKLKDAALDVQDVLEIYSTKALRMSRKKRRLLFSPLLRREAALNIKKIVNRINEISKERISFHRAPKAQTDPRTADAVIKNYGLQQTGSSRDSSDVYGREEDKEKVVKWMMSAEFDVEGEICVLPIIGMAGLGKTTLAQLLYNDERVSGHFEHRIWIDVTIRFSLDRIGKEIIEGVTGEYHPLTSWGSIVNRVDGLLKGKRFLLVLDDLWNERFIDWEKLQQLLRKGMEGSRVVITSRISGISRTVAARSTHFLDFLPEEACWSVFANIALSGGQGCVSLRDEIREIGREIVQKCNGLPLAVTGAAILLRGVTEINQWRRVRRDGIWETELKNAANGETYIMPALKFSYDHLPSHLKQCFAYCCIFPKGHIFDKGDLIKLWMAEGFIDLSGPGLPEETGSDYFKELRARSFFHPINRDDSKGYRIHNFLHDLATWVSQESAQVFMNDETSSSTLSSKCRYVSFVSKDVQEPASRILKLTKTRTILLPTNEKRDFGQVLDKMFNTLEYLRVLDLSSSNLEVLPESIGKLVLLQYLDLSRTQIRKLPGSVCSLVKLQTLKLLECLWLLKLPDGLSRLTNLRHLELDDMFWYNCSSLPPGIGSLTNLQNLHSFPVGRASGGGLEQLERLKYLTGKLCISQLENGANAADANLREKEDLQELVLKWSEGNASSQDPIAEERILRDLQPHSKIQRIQICHYNGSQFPTWMANESLQNLSKVSLSYCKNIKSLSLGLLCHVTEFYIKGMSELEEWEEAVYLNLKLLQISKCPKLRSLPSSFQNLKSMKIKCCDILKTLPLTPSLNSLILIDNIALEKMQEEAMSATETSNADGEAASVLKIVNCPKITRLGHTIQPSRLEISNCSLLKTLPFTEHSTHLKHVVIDRCSEESVVEAIPSSASVESLVLSNITKLIFLPVSLQLPGLKALYIHECENFTSLTNEAQPPLLRFTSLVLLSVSNCPKLQNLVSSDCGFPISLQHLSIKKCSNLESIGPQNCLSELAVLNDLYLEDCPKLKSFPEDEIHSSIKHLCIRGCPLISQSLSNDGSCSPWMAHIADLESDFT